MASTIISPKYPPLIDPTRATMAYGNRALVILKKNLETDDLLLKQRSMMSLSDHLHDPEHVSVALKLGFIDVLLELIHDADVTVRFKSAQVFFLLANHSVGRQALVDNDVIPALIFLLDDEEQIVRLSVYKALQMLSEMLPASEAILNAKLGSIMLKRIVYEPTEMKCLILDTLHNCFRINVQDGLDNSAMLLATDFINHDDVELRWRGVRCIADLCQVLEGKKQAIECMCTNRLIEMLAEKNSKVKINATNALMKIAITTKGKYTVLEAKAIPPLLDLLNDPCSEVRVNCLKTLTCLAEAPEGRALLKDHALEVKQLQFDTLPGVSRAATIALSKILWKP